MCKGHGCCSDCNPDVSAAPTLHQRPPPHLHKVIRAPGASSMLDTCWLHACMHACMCYCCRCAWMCLLCCSGPEHLRHTGGSSCRGHRCRSNSSCLNAMRCWERGVEVHRKGKPPLSAEASGALPYPSAFPAPAVYQVPSTPALHPPLPALQSPPSSPASPLPSHAPVVVTC